MIELFKISTNDVSMVYLSRIFGNVSGMIAVNGQTLGESINILSNMFKVFNGVVLTVAVLMLIYVTVIGVVGTAHDGEFMGKKMNNIWIPIRAVLGFALLVPTGAGYCGLQILMMWVMVQGVGAADVLWNTALSYINIVGTYPQIQIPSVSAQASLNSLFQGLTCDASAKFDGANPSSGPGSYYCKANGGCSSQPVSLDTNSSRLMLGPGNGNCGILQYCNQSNACGSSSQLNSLPCIACKNQVAALEKIVPTLSAIAMEMVKADYSYRDFYMNSGLPDSNTNNANWSWIYQYCSSKNIKRENCCNQSKVQLAIATAAAGAGGKVKTCASGFPNPDSQSSGGAQNASEEAVNMYWQFWPQLGPNLGLKTPFIQTAIDFYMDLAKGALTTYVAAQGQNSDNLGSMRDLADQGWILAGAFYYQLANQTGTDFKQALPNFSWTPPSTSTTLFRIYRNNFSAAQNLIIASSGIDDDSNDTSSNGSGTVNNKMAPVKLFSNMPSELGDLKQLDGVMTDGFQNVGSNFEASTTGGGTNPLVWLTILGQVLLSVASVIFFTILIVITVSAVLGSISVFVLGTGFTNPGTPTLDIVMFFIFPLIYAILGMCVTAGGLLAVYVPLIPFVIFAFGAIHWLISTVETMVAGPLVALGIISPSGQHELLGKAEPALMLLFNVFLRPSLMIFGLIAAMLLATVVQTLINSGFSIVFASGSIARDPLGLIIVLCVYVSLVIAALNKCFAVINLLPQKVMAWIGGQGEGVESPLQEIKGGSDTGVGAAKGGGSGMQESSAGVSKAADAESNKTGGTKVAESFKSEGKARTDKLKGGNKK